MAIVVKYEVSLDMDAIQCGECAITFGVPATFRNERIKDHRTFYCPNGHSRCYPEKTAEQKRIEELEQERQRLTAARDFWRTESERRASQLTSKEQELKRIEKRVKHGVCPCCKRTFKQLARHMETKHPGWSGASR